MMPLTAPANEAETGGHALRLAAGGRCGGTGGRRAVGGGRFGLTGQ
ncbi:MAG: hypothetical protein N3J91_04040 [Verrucomicrobiae bacterium]|nr:hypothetical protein [Verrucomicrobiae bacterium]